LRTFHTQATARAETVFLFRFAVTDYHSKWLTLFNNIDTAWWEYILGWIITQQRNFEGEVYKAQQTVFFDFDIISLTFKSDDLGYYTIPVVSDPQDIIPDVTPPAYDPPPQWGWNPEWPDWLRWVMLGLGLFIIFFVVFIVIKIVMLLFIPLSLIAAVVPPPPQPKKYNRDRFKRRRRG